MITDNQCGDKSSRNFMYYSLDLFNFFASQEVEVINWIFVGERLKFLKLKSSSLKTNVEIENRRFRTVRLL